MRRSDSRGHSPLPDSPKKAVPEDSFVLFRIVGNDLYPRHQKGQSFRNVSFILEHEPPLENCVRKWIVNRIVDPAEEERIVTLLSDAGESFLRLPFSDHEYAACPWDPDCQPSPGFYYSKKPRKLKAARRERFLYALYRTKINYVINNNGARNAALREGRQVARWVLPWDGNCFVTAQAWEAIREAVQSDPGKTYRLTPMARIRNNADLLTPNFAPDPVEEPQIIFRNDAPERFDETVPYGRRPKVDLLWRLGVPGPWDHWRIEAWDLPKPSPVPTAGAVGRAGWVARLDSGQSHLESDERSTISKRGLARITSVITLLDNLDVNRMRHLRAEDSPLFYDRSHLAQLADGGGDGSSFIREQRDALLKAGDEALGRGPYSVVEKTTLPPSRDPHDYWHPSPYYWPRHTLLRWLPFTRRDGERAPGTKLYEPSSDRYDRTRLQRLVDDVTILALAWDVSKDSRYSSHAARLVRTWFLDPNTMMNPHLKFAQVRPGRDWRHGSKSGVIELKDLYFFLDAMRILRASTAWSETDEEGFRSWLKTYLDWLLTSPQGIGESGSPNNHGTCYDLQVASVASYLGDFLTVQHTLRRSYCRIGDQFTTEGDMPYELKRTLTRHYYAFNLQAWVHLARLAEAHGSDLWEFQTADGKSLKKALERFFEYAGKPWPHPQIAPFDPERLTPLRRVYSERFGPLPGEKMTGGPFKPIYFPHDGIRPFWFLG